MLTRHIIYIPGLHDRVAPRPWLSRVLPFFWRPYGFVGHVMTPHWEAGEFEAKLQVVIDKIDDLTARGCTVSLVGQSAGSSLALNAFAARRESVAGVIILTGRLRVSGEPSLEVASRHSSAFAESVRRAEAILEKLSRADRARIMTIRPTADKVVPPASVPVNGAINVVSRVRGHSFGGAMLASFASRQWLQFLRSSRPAPR